MKRSNSRNESKSVVQPAEPLTDDDLFESIASRQVHRRLEDTKGSGGRWNAEVIAARLIIDEMVDQERGR